jgi:hypothetical protein
MYEGIQFLRGKKRHISYWKKYQSIILLIFKWTVSPSSVTTLIKKTRKYTLIYFGHQWPSLEGPPALQCNHAGAPHSLKLQIYFLPNEELHDFKSTMTQDSQYRQQYFSTDSRLDLGPSQPPIHWIPTVPSLGWRAGEWNWLFLSSTQIKNAWSYTSNSPYSLIAWWLIKHRNNFTLL